MPPTSKIGHCKRSLKFKIDGIIDAFLSDQLLMEKLEKKIVSDPVKSEQANYA